MKSIARLFLLLGALALGAAAHAESVVRVTNGEWPPYLSEQLPHHGVASRIVTEAFAAQGITVQYGFFPWRRGLALAEAGEWDGTAVWLKTPERERDFFLSNPVMYTEYLFFHLKDTPFDWSSIADLAKYPIGISNDYFYGEEFMAAMANGRLMVESVPTDEQNFRKLLHRRIDAFPIPRITGMALLTQVFSAEETARVTMHPKPLYSEAMYLLLTKKNPRNRQLMDEFNKGLRKLKASGRLDLYLKDAERPPSAWVK